MRFLNSHSISFIRKKKPISQSTFMAHIHSLKLQWQDSLRQYSRVALGCEDLYHFACAWIALMSLGKTVVMLPNQQQGTQQQFSAHYDILMDDNDIVLSSHHDIRRLEINPEAITVFFTSGSQGEPKAYPRRYAQLVAESEAIQDALGTRVNDHTTVYASVSHLHLYGFSFHFLWPLLQGMTIQTEKLLIVESIEETISNGNAAIVTTPVMIARLEQNDDYDPSVLVISSASALAHDIAEQFYHRYGQSVFEVYGSTETGVIAHRQQLDNPLWQCFKSVSIAVNEQQQLLVHSDFCQPQMMADQVKLINKGYFELLGRLDRTVKIAGKRLCLSGLEKYLAQHIWVKEAVCVVRQSYRDYIGAMIVLSDQGKSELQLQGKRLLCQQLNQYLLECYERVTLPKQWRIVDEMPTNAQGKKVLSEIHQQFEV